MVIYTGEFDEYNKFAFSGWCLLTIDASLLNSNTRNCMCHQYKARLHIICMYLRALNE